MKSKIIVTLIFTLLLAVFTIFNRQQVKIFFFNFSLIKTGLATIVFWTFITGAVYAAILAVISQMRLRKIISRQKGLIEELESKNGK